MNLNKLPVFPPNVLGIDIETPNELDRFKAKIAAIGLSDGDDTWILTERYDRLAPILENPNVVKIFHNADFDVTTICYRLLRDYGIEVKPVNIYDTMLVERLLNNGLSISNRLDDTLARRLGIYVDKSLQQSFTNDEFTPEQLEYLSNDCKHLPQLRNIQLKEAESCNMLKVVELENKDILVTLDKTLTGVGIDLVEFEAIKTQIPVVLDQIVDQIANILGEDFYVTIEYVKGPKEIDVRDIKWNAWNQIKPALLKMGIKVPNTQKSTLEERAERFPVVQLILDYKKWHRMLGWHWGDFINSETGRIHPSWNQTGTGTGRFSCSDPNLQQVPRPEPSRPNFRALFKPLTNHKMLIADWSQQEPRILAHVSQDPRMIEAANESDIYCAFAKGVWKEEITKHDPRRQQMKVGVLASFYGVWYKNLAPKMGVSEKQAEQVQNSIFKAYANAKRWGDYQIKAVMQHGYTQSVLGRRIYFENTPSNMKWRLEKEARNYPIQMTGADMAKLAEVKIYDIIQQKNYDAHFIIGLHDELVLSCAEEQAEDCFQDMVQAMMDAGSELCPSVRFPVEGVISDVWEH